MVLVILLVTPLAGWALDHAGYQVLFPIGALFGILATYFFTRIDLDEGQLPPRQTKTFEDLWQIVRSDRNFAVYLFGNTLFGLGGLLAWPLHPIVQVDRLQLSYSEIWIIGFGRVVYLAAELSFVGADDRQTGRPFCCACDHGDFYRDASHLHDGPKPVDVDTVGSCARNGDGGL